MGILACLTPGHDGAVVCVAREVVQAGADEYRCRWRARSNTGAGYEGAEVKQKGRETVS